MYNTALYNNILENCFCTFLKSRNAIHGECSYSI